MKITNAIEQYLNSRSSRLADNTISVYGSTLRKFKNWTGDLDLSNVNDDHVDGYLGQLKKTHSEKTRENHANALKTFFKYWSSKRESSVTWELITGPRVPERFPAFITPEQFDLIDDCLDEDEYNQLTKKVMFHLLWNTGMRISELLSLNISDIDVQKNYCRITTLKSKKLRLVMWNDECHRLLVRYLGIRVCLNRGAELFQTPPNPKHASRRTRLTPRSVQRWCKELEENLGFRIHPHAFRHGKCHEVLNSGGNRHQIQTIAGHSSINSSEVYTRLNLTEQAQLLQRFLPGKRQPDRNIPQLDRPLGFAL